MKTKLSFSPKQQFIRRHHDLSLQLNQTVAEPWFQESMVYALSQMTDSGATKEELQGAKKFRDIFTTLGEPVDDPEPRPDKSNPEWENVEEKEE
jgi:hypothetical protein